MDAAVFLGRIVLFLDRDLLPHQCERQRQQQSRTAVLTLMLMPCISLVQMAWRDCSEYLRLDLHLSDLWDGKFIAAA